MFKPKVLGDAMYWLAIFWPTICICVSFMLVIIKRFARNRGWWRTGLFINIFFSIMNSTIIVLLLYQWTSYEIAYNKLDTQHPNLIRGQCTASTALALVSASMLVTLAIIGLCHRFKKRPLPSFVRKCLSISGSAELTAQSMCTIMLAVAWILTASVSVEAKMPHAGHKYLLDGGQYEKFGHYLSTLAAQHVGVMLSGWFAFFFALFLHMPGLLNTGRQLSAYFWPKPVSDDYVYPAMQYGGDDIEMQAPRKPTRARQHTYTTSTALLRPMRSLDSASSTWSSHLQAPTPPLRMSQLSLASSLYSFDSFDLAAPPPTPYFVPKSHW
ncbi:hypothetical protein AJ79_06257 [Helicocarpus griseus UAMH5409]|uniref:Uncharacterized protein n=1 Tax=Helicocarpus griseus UAMH5409 TaxID=1447875 RepID=A0A2B7XFL7_9EURO|nr:hypothetical protein AJ79_06257 [Helicocarpus griseus UAMH5409]